MKDGIGREFDDELTDFLNWYLDAGLRIFTPLDNSIHFVENLTSTCIYRHEQFQVEFVTVKPNTYIPPHTHPNVDSYEVALKGIEYINNCNVYETLLDAVGDCDLVLAGSGKLESNHASTEPIQESLESATKWICNFETINWLKIIYYNYLVPCH